MDTLTSTTPETGTVRTLQDALMSELSRHGMSPDDHEGMPDQHDGLTVHFDSGSITVRVEDGPVATLVATGVDGRAYPHPANPFTDAKVAALAVARAAHRSFTGPRRAGDGTALPAVELLFEAAP